MIIAITWVLLNYAMSDEVIRLEADKNPGFANFLGFIVLGMTFVAFLEDLSLIAFLHNI